MRISWQRIPFVRILFPFLIGLLLAYYFPDLSCAYLALGITVIALIVLCFWAKQKRISPASVRYWAVLASITLITLGYSRSFFEDARHWANHIVDNLKEGPQVYVARIQSEVRLKNSSVQAELELLRIKDGLGQWQKVQGSVLASFQLDSLAAKLQYGQGLLIHIQLNEIEGSVNPNAFNAKQFYQHKNIHYRGYLKSAYWQTIEDLNGGYLYKKKLLDWRNYLLSVFKKYLGQHSNEYAVAAALILGAKQEVSAELRNAYADTGATHVLAVSGLHVGLVAMLLSLVLNLGGKKKRKAWKQATLLLIGIWFFAFLSGASASVIRASTMFSFLTIGDALGRRSSVYNTLAASAFFILCFQPYAFWDLGFQLSYLAVVGIIYLQPKIYRWVFIPNRLGDYIWNLISVSLAAQFATLPICLLYFHQFPLYFWLSGLVVIPLATVILVLGITTLILGGIPFVGNLLAQALSYVIFVMNAAIFSIQQLPFAKLEGFWLENWQASFCYFMMISFVIGFQYKRRAWNLVGFSFLLILSVSVFFKNLQQQKQEKIFVYKVYRGSTIDFIKGHKAVTLVDSLHGGPKQLKWTNQNNLWAHGVQSSTIYSLGQDSIDNDFVYMHPAGYGQFSRMRFAILAKDLASRPLAANDPLEVDWLLIQGNPYLRDITKLEELVDYQYLVFDASNSPWNLARWRQECQLNGIPYIDCSEEGKELPR